MGKYVDLHTHSDFSDGTDRPASILTKAKKVGLSAIAITDHDTVAGQYEAIELAKQIGIEYVTGLEFSTAYKDTKFHILGYFIDPANSSLITTGKTLLGRRKERGEKILNKLNKLGLHLELDDVLPELSGSSLTRLHFAKALIKKGYVKNVQKAFALYLGEGKPAYVAKKNLTPKEAIKLIHNAGGIASWAHPFTMGDINLLPQLVNWGLDGVEVFYPEHFPENMAVLKRYAHKYGLVMTGGSDYHGKAVNRPQIGEYKCPYQIVEDMRERLNSIREYRS